MAVNRSSERKRVTPLLSSSFLFWALMALNCFTKLQLPASVKVPAGAIAHVGADEAFLLRSQHTVPLRQQHAEFKDEADLYGDARVEDECPPVLRAYFDTGQLTSAGCRCNPPHSFRSRKKTVGYTYTRWVGRG